MGDLRDLEPVRQVLEGGAVRERVDEEGPRAAAVMVDARPVRGRRRHRPVVAERPAIREVIRLARVGLGKPHDLRIGRVLGEDFERREIDRRGARRRHDLGRGDPAHLVLVRRVDLAEADAAVAHEIRRVAVLAVEHAVVVRIG